MTQLFALLTLIWTTLTNIPVPVWTGLMGSTFTLLGVLVANRHSKRQMKLQLDHDALEKKKARISEMRKSVYLPAADEMVRANSLIGQIPDTNLSNANIGKDLAPFFASMLKLQMVGEHETARLANSLASTYGELLGSTIIKALPIREAESNLEIKNGRYEELQVEIKRLLAAITTHTENGVRDQVRFDALMQALEQNQRWAAEVEGERVGLRKKNNDLRLDFLQYIVPTMREVSSEFLPLLVEVRRELDLTGDIDAFRTMLDMQAKRMEGMVRHVTEDIKTRMLVDETEPERVV